MELPVKLEAVQKALQEWPVDRLFPLIDWLRVQVLTRDIPFHFIPIDRIISAQANGSKAEQAALTMSLRFYCNYLVKIEAGKFSGDELVSIIGASTAILSKNTTWTGLLLSLLNK